MPYSHIIWSQQQQQSLLTSAMIIPGLAQYALLLPQAFKISPPISSLYNMNFVNGTGMLVNTTLIVLTVITCRLVDLQELDLLLSQDMLRCQEILSQKGRRGGGGFRPQFRSNSQSNSS